MSEPRMEALAGALRAIMDAGFRSGDRYVYADELAFLLGHAFTFENEDGSITTFDGTQSWLRDYPHSQNEIGIALAALAAAPTPPIEVKLLARVLIDFDIISYDSDPHGVLVDLDEVAAAIAAEYARLLAERPADSESNG